jgi:tetratricopeptide (TPR) repeat protein
VTGPGGGRESAPAGGLAAGGGGQAVAGSVVLGDVFQFQNVGGNVTVTLSRPAYRVDEFAAARVRLTAEQARAQPSRLLLARYELVPFTGRTGLVAELSGWLAEAGAASVRLVYGSGGQGKSRLAAQFARHHAAEWAVWQARQALPGAQQPARLPAAPAGVAGVLVVADYADRWPADSLQALISDLHAMTQQLPEALPLRVLLLARAAGLWWEALEQRLDTDYGIPAAAQVLPPLGGEVSRDELFTVAWDHFAAALGVTGAVPAGAGAAAPAGLGGPGFGLVLTVHMTALAGVDACRQGETAPGDPARVSAYLLKRERAHWQQWHARGEDRLATPPQVMGRAVYAATLAGPLPQADGVTALARAQVAAAPDHARQVLDDHRKCYPAQNPATVLEPLYPDRLGEDFLALTTPGQPGGTAADLAAFTDAWAADAIPGLLAPGAEQDQPPWSGPAVTVLIETARRWPHMAAGQLYPLLRARPELALQAGAAALAALAGLPGVDVTVLEAIEARSPADRNVNLDIGIAAVTARLATDRLAANSDPADHARIHHDLAIRLSNAGLHQQALAAARAASQILQQLAAADRHAYRPALATSLGTYATFLAEVGRRAEAVPVSEEAVRLRRELVGLNRAAYLPDLASSLNNHALRLAETGRRAQAVLASEEAVALYGELVGLNRAAYLPGLAASLNNHALRLAETGRRAQAVPVSEEAVALYGELVGLNRAAYLPGLAASLANHALQLAGVGRRAEAVPVSEQAVALYGELVGLNRAAYLPGLAASLANHTNRLAEVGRRAEAVPVSEQAVALYGELVGLNRAAYLPGLAASLANHAAMLAGVGRRAEAVPVSEQAVRLRRELVGLNRDAYLPGLAASLANHAAMLAGMGRRAEAVPVSEQAVRLRRELVGLNRDAYLPDLATSLNNHAAMLAGTRRAETLPMLEEALALYDELVGLNRDAYLPDYTQTLGTFGYVLIEDGRLREAIAPLTAALQLSQQLPDHAQGIVAALAHLLRRAYADDPATVRGEFRTLTGQALPPWMTEQPTSQE